MIVDCDERIRTLGSTRIGGQRFPTSRLCLCRITLLGSYVGGQRFPTGRLSLKKIILLLCGI